MTTLITDKELLNKKLLDEKLKKEELEKYFNNNSKNFSNKVQGYFSNNLFYLCTIILIFMIIIIMWLGHTLRNQCRNLQYIVHDMSDQGNQMLGMYGNLSSSMMGNQHRQRSRLHGPGETTG